MDGPVPTRVDLFRCRPHHDARNDGCLKVTGLWLEPKVAMTQDRERKLLAELKRIQRFVGAAALDIAPSQGA